MKRPEKLRLREEKKALREATDAPRSEFFSIKTCFFFPVVLIYTRKNACELHPLYLFTYCAEAVLRRSCLVDMGRIGRAENRACCRRRCDRLYFLPEEGGAPHGEPIKHGTKK